MNTAPTKVSPDLIISWSISMMISFLTRLIFLQVNSQLTDFQGLSPVLKSNIPKKFLKKPRSVCKWFSKKYSNEALCNQNKNKQNFSKQRDEKNQKEF